MMPEKKPKDAVHYSLGGDHCDVCTHYTETNEAAETGTCELVEGSIRGDYWCRLFKRKRSKQRVLRR